MAANKTGEGRVGRGLTDHVYVDVDGTLLLWQGGNVDGPNQIERAIADRSSVGEELTPEEKRLMPKVNHALVKRLLFWYEQRPEGSLVVWSMGGVEHAKMARRLCRLPPGTICLGKPDAIIDDASGAIFNRKNFFFTPEQFCVV